MTKKALTLALEALEKERPYLGAMPALTSKAITAIKKALSELEQDDEVLGFNGWGFPIEKPSQPKQEPATKEQIREAMIFNLPLYTAPPQPEQEPVAYPVTLPWDNNPEKHPQFYTWTWDEFVSGGKWRAEYGWKKPTGKVTNLQALYTTPPQRTWVGLTDAEVNELVEHTECEDYYGLVEATEAKLKEKNT